MIPNENELISLAAEKGIACYSVDGDIKEAMEMMMDLDHFLDFVASKHGDIFYCYFSFDESDILIGSEQFDDTKGELGYLINQLELEEDFPNYLDCFMANDSEAKAFLKNNPPSELYLQICKKIIEYDISVDRSVIGLPFILDLYTIYQGVVLKCELLESKIHPVLAEEALKDILHGFENMAEELRAKREKLLEETIVKLHDEIRNDPKLMVCTNIQLRRDYAERLWKSTHGQSVYRPVFNHDGPKYYIPPEFYTEIERVYHENRLAAKKK